MITKAVIFAMNTILQVDHERFLMRLAQSLPTVWVLLGPSDAVLLEWNQFVEQHNLSYALVHDRGERSHFNEWIRTWLKSNNLLVKSAEYAASLNSYPLENTTQWMQGKSAEERRLFVENHLTHRQPSPVDKLVQAVLLKWKSLETNPNDLTQQLSLLNETFDDLVQKVGALTSLTPSTSPALVLISDDDPIEWKKSCVLQLAQLAFAVPALPLAWGVSQKQYKAFMQKMPESKEKTLCRELVSVISPYVDKEESDLINLSEQQRETLASLERDGSAPTLLEKFMAAVEALQATDRREPQGVERARSAAEAFLFERLELLPETRGLFHLNRKIKTDSAEWSILEIDLFCKALRIAIEVDGYYHFLDREAYRRDRQKDYLMQREDCFVLRFHAEDIVEYLEGILKTIVETINLRKRQTMKA